MKNVIHKIDSKNERLVLLARFTAKFGLVFVVTLENALVISCFYVTISGNYGRFQHFNFKPGFLENGNLFPKTGVPIFS